MGDWIRQKMTREGCKSDVGTISVKAVNDVIEGNRLYAVGDVCYFTDLRFCALKENDMKLLSNNRFTDTTSVWSAVGIT